MGAIKLEDSSEKIIVEVKKKPRLLKIKKRLRPLVKSVSFKPIALTEDESDDNSNDLKIEHRWNRKLYFLGLAVIIASYMYTQITVSSCGFWATFENNYNKIVHKDERYCFRGLEPLPIIDELKKRVIGQDDAISLIEGSLGLVNREKIVQVAFVGSIGVGKTLSANLIGKFFKWQRNVNYFIFDMDFKTDSNESDFNVVTSRLSDCGFNLIVIDDVDSNSALRIAELERRLHRLAKQNLFKIIFIVIFEANAEASVIQETLKDFVIVEFNPINEKSFEECIAVHERLHNIKLKPKDIEELKFIDYTSSGCKTLDKKLNLIVHE